MPEEILLKKIADAWDNWNSLCVSGQGPALKALIDIGRLLEQYDGKKRIP